eukprot:936111-Rhodomonas_salina.1
MAFSLIHELPGPILGRAWPGVRVVMGMRVCKWLRQTAIGMCMRCEKIENILFRIKNKPVVWSERGISACTRYAIPGTDLARCATRLRLQELS